MKRNKTIIFSLLFIAAIQLLISCANIVSPSGGPKDEIPPKPTSSEPLNYSTNFKQKKIEITFNEFIVLKDIRTQLIVSPPFKELPEVKAKGKTLIIDFKEDLKENTTYTLCFGDAVTDLTEGNPIPSYEFVFSTGNILDSLTIIGKVIDAFTQKPEKDVFVMLYDKNYDSIPYKERPYYMTKTNENGTFSLNNLRNIPYKIFALKDINNNFKFDQPIERIAYADSLVTPHFKPVIKKDTSLKDSLQPAIILKDSLLQDSIKQTDLTIKLLSVNDLQLFQEIDSTQKIIKVEFKNNRKIQIEFRYPVKNLKYKILNDFGVENWKIDEWNKNKDSLIFWLLKPDIDSVSLIIEDIDGFSDTLHIYQRKTIKPITKSSLRSNLSQTINFNDKINLYFTFPVLAYDSIPVILIAENDTNATYAYYKDSLHRNFELKENLIQNKTYKLIVNENIVQDITENKNDSLVFSFKTNSQEELGNFILKISSKDTSNYFIIQLLNEKEEIIKQAYFQQNDKINFNNISPGNYMIKAIKDKNRNQRWDTGNYLKKIQPEETIFYPVKITIRANWDLEESWSF